jgi:hypothetical protein
VTRGSLAISRYRAFRRIIARTRKTADQQMDDQGNFRVGHLLQSAVLDARFANITATDS